MDKTKGSRNIDIEIIRIFAIIAIMALHFQEDFVRERFVFAGGYLGVDIFFMMAGFFCFMQCRKNSKLSFPLDVFRHGMKRVRQLWPPFFIAVVFWLIFLFFENNFSFSYMIHHLWGTKYQWIWLHFLGGVGGYEFRTLWYLPILFWTELFLVCMLCRDWKSYIAVAPCMGVLLIAFLAHNFDSLSMQGEWIYVVQGGIVRAFAEMTVGCVAGYVCEVAHTRQIKIREGNRIWFGGVKLFCFVNIFGVMFAFGFDKTDFWVIPNMFILLILCWLIPIKFPESVKKIVLYISKHVYWVYLLHLLVSKVLIDYFNTLSISVAATLFYVCSFGISIVMDQVYAAINRFLFKRRGIKII